MPPHRRRPAPTSGQAPPIRRPRVAGLRNRPGHAADDQVEQQDQAEEQPTAVDDRDSVREDDRESVSGVLNGVLGEPPATRDEPEPDDETDEPVSRVDDRTDTAVEDEPEQDDAVAATTVTRPKPRPRPEGDRRPAGKRRATGAARPTDLAAAETTEKTRPVRHAMVDDRPDRTKASRQISVAIVLAVVAVVLAGLAVFFRGEANGLTSGDSNTALTDSAATSQLKGQLTTAIKQTFSYNYTDLDSTEKAVKENLTGKALCEYNLLFGQVKEYAPAQKIVLDTSVRELAVVRIDGDRAEALVYIDQLSTRVDVNKTVAVRGQFAVQAHRDGDHWKITAFDMFGQPLFDGKAPPKC